MKRILIHAIKRCYSFFILLPFLFLNSCSSSIEPEIIFFETPVINGIILTGWDSPDEIGRWRNPQYPPGISYNIAKDTPEKKEKDVIILPTVLDMDNPYSNPTADAVVIRFNLPVGAEVYIWLVKGRLPEENPHPIETGSGGIFISQKDKISAVVIEKEKLSAGLYQRDFDGKIGEEYIPTGFYRIYLKADKHLLWRDILVARSKADLPPELKDKYFNNN